MTLKVKGGYPLKGIVEISGSKNDALPAMAASLLTTDDIYLTNIPHLTDIVAMKDLLSDMGCYVEFNLTKDGFQHEIKINTGGLRKRIASYDIVSKMRASILVLGPMVAFGGYAQVSLPGGCAIGIRPIDMHLSALEQMGANIKLEEGYIIAEAKNGLKGAEIFFDKISVGATENTLMAATLAQGQTIIHNAAREPEIENLIVMLNKMGAKIKGIGTDTLVIEGVAKLKGCRHEIIPDRIEAGTFAIAAAASKGDLIIKNCNPKHLSSLLHYLKLIGVEIEEYSDYLRIYRMNDILTATQLHTGPYPNFPTDIQAQFMTLLCLADGISHITETIWENRLMHVNELQRMGANITVMDNLAIITGIDSFTPAEVKATDLRASASLIIAAICARGESTIHCINHLDRGYDKIEVKLNNCGAQIQRYNSTVKS